MCSHSESSTKPVFLHRSKKEYLMVFISYNECNCFHPENISTEIKKCIIWYADSFVVPSYWPAYLSTSSRSICLNYEHCKFANLLHYQQLSMVYYFWNDGTTSKTSWSNFGRLFSTKIYNDLFFHFIFGPVQCKRVGLILLMFNFEFLTLKDNLDRHNLAVEGTQSFNSHWGFKLKGNDCRFFFPHLSNLLSYERTNV